MTSRPRLGISACLLGQPVRFDGGHKRHDWICDVLSTQVELVPICPELALGLGMPRPALRLVSGGRLVTTREKTDLTARAKEKFEPIAAIASELDGYILKKDSPSCGLERVKVYAESGMPRRTGVGLFAEALLRANPLLPMIEEGRLRDPAQRENFILRLFAHHRLRAVGPSQRLIQDFHRRHKLLLLEHWPKYYAELGKIVGNPERLRAAQVLERYRPLFLRALERLPTVGTRTNVLEHALGYLRGRADRADRAQLAESIALFRRGELPFIAALTVELHLIRKLGIRYLEDQYFFLPYPRALGAA